MGGRISSGIGMGFIAFTAIKLASGRFSDINPAVLAIALAFVFKFAML